MRELMQLMPLKHASSFFLAMAMLMVSTLGSACDARCALGAAGHHYDAQRGMDHAMHSSVAEAGMQHCAGAESAMHDGRGQARVHAACTVDHVWAAGEQASAYFDIAACHGFANAILPDARAYDQTGAMMWLRPPIHRASRATRTISPLRI